jgi:hypothetical protein
VFLREPKLKRLQFKKNRLPFSGARLGLGAGAHARHDYGSVLYKAKGKIQLQDYYRDIKEIRCSKMSHKAYHSALQAT